MTRFCPTLDSCRCLYILICNISLSRKSSKSGKQLKVSSHHITGFKLPLVQIFFFFKKKNGKILKNISPTRVHTATGDNQNISNFNRIFCTKKEIESQLALLTSFGSRRVEMVLRCFFGQNFVER